MSIRRRKARRCNGARAAVRARGNPVAIPTALQVGGTYLIYSEVSYSMCPTVGYVMTKSITLSDLTYTRPRQSTCVIYPTPLATA